MSNSPPQPSNPEVSIATGFALMLETACEDFEILQRMIRHEIKLVSGNGIEDYRAPLRINGSGKILSIQPRESALYLRAWRWLADSRPHRTIAVSERCRRRGGYQRRERTRVRRQGGGKRAAPRRFVAHQNLKAVNA